MLSRCKLIGLLTPRQLEVLKCLCELKEQTSDSTLWRPKDLGAFRSSHHTKTLQGLETQGLVKSQSITEGLKPQFGYCITDKGCETLDIFRHLLEVPVDAIMGTATDKMRARWAARMAA